MDAKLCIGMPASHHKHKVQNVRVVGFWQDTIEDWQDALWCVGSDRQYRLEHPSACPYLEKVLIVMGSKLLHLRCIANEPVDPILPKRCDKSEPTLGEGLTMGRRHGEDQCYLSSRVAIALEE